MPATTITYNGVTVSNVETQFVRSDPVYDEAGVVVEGVRRTIGFRGTVNDPDSETFIDSLEELTSKLSVPRAALSITLNGETFASVTPALGGLTTSEMAMGPIPRNVTVNRFFGGRAARVSAEIEWMEPLDKEANSTPAILSSRWEQSFDIDSRGYTTRIVRGTVKFSSRVASINPDSFRCYIFPVETAGFAIKANQWVVDQTGRSLAYQVVQEEKYRPYAKGILHAEARCTIEVKGGAAVTKTLTGKMEGAKTLPKQVLVDAVADLVVNRFNFQKETVRDWTFSEDVYGGNSLEFSIESTGTFGTGTGKPAWISLFRRAHTSQASPLGLAGRFKQVDAYGNALVRAAFQALFSSVTDGNPGSASALAKANTDRWSREDLIDDDEDGYADRVCALPDIEAAELCDELVDDIGFGLTDRPYSLSALQESRNVITESVQTVQRRVVTHMARLTFADPDTADEMIQYAKPHVEELHAGYIKRIGEPPEVPIPEEITAQTNRKVALLEARQVSLPVEPSGDGGSLVYGNAYAYRFSRPYIESDTTSWENVSIRYAGNGSSQVVLQYRAGESIRPPQNPALLAGVASLIPIEEGGYFA